MEPRLFGGFARQAALVLGNNLTIFYCCCFS